MLRLKWCSCHDLWLNREPDGPLPTQTLGPLAPTPPSAAAAALSLALAPSLPLPYNPSYIWPPLLFLTRAWLSQQCFSRRTAPPSFPMRRRWMSPSPTTFAWNYFSSCMNSNRYYLLIPRIQLLQLQISKLTMIVVSKDYSYPKKLDVSPKNKL